MGAERRDQTAGHASLRELNDIADRIIASTRRGPGERAWATGYRAARAFRDVLDIPPGKGLTSPGDIARRLGSHTFACTSGVAGVSALVSRGDGDVRIHVRERGAWDWARHAESFAFARALGDAVCYRDTQRSVVNNLHQAERQAVGRAFAAEFLAPVKRVLYMTGSGCDVDEIAGSLDVSPQVIDWQLENQERIRQACARPPIHLRAFGSVGPFVVTEEAMSLAIERLRTRRNRTALEKYDRLRRSLLMVDVISDRDFQSDFKSFYRVIRGKEWCESFFSILEREKDNSAPSFGEVLAAIHEKTGRVEASFSSKLVATIDADRPVWDRHVLANLGLRPPYWSMDTRRRVGRCIELYSKIRTWTSTAIRQDSFEEWRRRFDDAFPPFGYFTDIKKLDLLLWQSRRS